MSILNVSSEYFFRHMGAGESPGPTPLIQLLDLSYNTLAQVAGSYPAPFLELRLPSPIDSGWLNKLPPPPSHPAP